MKFKKLLMALPALTLLTPTVCNVFASCSATNYSIKKGVKMMESDTKEVLTTDLLYKNGSQIAYISIDNAMKVIKKMHTNVFDNVWTATVKKDGSNVIATRETGAKCIFNPVDNTITFPDYVAFVAEGTSRVSCQIRDYGGLKHYKESGVQYVAYGDTDIRVKTKPQKVFELTPYDLHLITYNNEVYIPVQTLSDIFLSDCNQPIVALKDILVPVLSIPSEINDKTYNPLPDYLKNNALTANQELLDFNYKELCFYWDHVYGLKENKCISDFDTIFRSNSIDGTKTLRESFLSSAKEADDALNWLIGYICDDGHSRFLHRNPSNPETTKLSVYKSIWRKYLDSERARYIALRGEYKTNWNQYVEVSSSGEGNADTAIIRFDSFRPIPDGFKEGDIPDEPNKAGIEGNYAMPLFTSAYKKIAANSNIKNVVVDISCNGGGDARFCVFLACMLSGGEVNVAHMNNVDSSIDVCSYYADANMDGIIDDKDFAFKDKNIYILTSTYSFSCATLLPTWVFQKPNIKVIGKRTGGGSCAVFPSTNALGTKYQMSGAIQAGYIKNGIFYNNDAGIEPAFFVPDDVYYSNGGIDLAKYIASHQ